MSGYRWAVLVFLCVWAIAAADSMSTEQKPTSFEILLKRLQQTETASDAGEKLLEFAKSDSSARKLLARHLPPLIRNGPRGEAAAAAPWLVAVNLAGTLKLAEASDALSHWIDYGTGGTLTLGQEARLEHNPAAKALAQIGDAAIPAVSHILKRGVLNSRWTSVLILTQIGSPNSRKALKDHLNEEEDLELREFIKRATAPK